MNSGVEACVGAAARGRWMLDAGWGLFCHYLGDESRARAGDPLSPAEWNHRVDDFDVDALARSLAAHGVPYFCLTLGQNSGHFCAPNQHYDAVVQDGESRLSRRDLVADLATALRSVDIPLLVYLPSHAPAYHRAAVEALACTPPWDASRWQLRPGTYQVDALATADPTLTRFQGHWEAIIREWSLRWGDLVAGWWIDGMYYHDRMYTRAEAPNLASLATALRAGNPASLIACNGGIRGALYSLCSQEDVIAGEVADLLPVGHWDSSGYRPRPLADGPAGLHVLTFLGEYWNRGEPRFPDELVIGYTRYIADHGGAVTWEVPIDHRGRIPDSHWRQVGRLASAHSSHRGRRP